MSRSDGVSSIAGHGRSLQREIVSFLPERTKECLLCVGFASNTIWHIEMGWSRQEEYPTVTGFLGMSKLFFFYVLLSFRITTLHLTGTVKYNETGRGVGGGGVASTKTISIFSKLKYLWNIRHWQRTTNIGVTGFYSWHKMNYFQLVCRISWSSECFNSLNILIWQSSG